jgi:hypothetical protein
MTKDKFLLGKPPASRSKLQTFNSLGILILILGSLILSAVLSLLTILWSRSPGLIAVDPSRSWERMVLNGPLTRIIALSTIAIRIVVAFQGAFATALISAMLLERASVPLKEVPRVLTLRSSWSGAHNLLYGYASRHSALYTVLAVVLLFMNVLSQFSSTLLLSDLRNSFVANSTNLASVPVGIRTNDTNLFFTGGEAYLERDVNPWLSPLPTYPTFAEWAPSQLTNNIENIDDTGDTIRAYLPFTDATDRKLTKRYSGYLMATELRFTCSAPDINVAQLIPVAGFNGLSAPVYINYTTSNPDIQVENVYLGSIKSVSQTSGTVYCWIATPNSATSKTLAESTITACSPEMGDWVPPMYKVLVGSEWKIYS